MLRVVVLALGLALGVTSCAFAQKHPAITSGIVAGTIGTVTCLPAVEKQTTCLWIGAVAGLAIGGITGLVTTFADTSAHQLPPFEEEEPPIVRRKKPAPPAEPAPSPAPPSPAPPAPSASAAPPPSTPAPVDAGVPALDAGAAAPAAP